MNGKGMGKVLRLIIDYLHKMRPKFNSNSAFAKLSYAVIHPNYGHRRTSCHRQQGFRIHLLSRFKRFNTLIILFIPRISILMLQYFCRYKGNKMC